MWPSFALLLLQATTTLLLVQAQVQPNLEKVVIDNRATISGLRETDIFGTTYYSFKGVPYAEPPIGYRRWTDTIMRPATSLNGYAATRFRSKCTQWSRSEITGSGIVGNEDCLFLNIYTRNLPDVSGNAQASRPTRPVIFYIHGGGFMYSSGDAIGPGHFLRHKDIVLVTFNYRLGVFGFLSTNDTALPGNYGLLDQITALEWVNRYIQYFGGDVRRITIMGHSAGAALTHILTLSPLALAKDLFSGAIIQSGSALCDWSIQKNSREYATAIGESVNCSTYYSTDLVECLRTKTAYELLQAQTDQLDFWVLPLRTAPVVDAGLRKFPVLPEHPDTLLSTGQYAKVPMIVGTTKDEGLMGYAFLHLHEVERFNDNEYFHDKLVPKAVRNIFGGRTEDEVKMIAKAVEEYYFKGVNVSTYQGSQQAISEMTNLFGDSMFYSCHWDMLEKYAAVSAPNVYNYVFSYKRPRSPKILGQIIPKLRGVRVNHPLFDAGVAHGEDMFYFFHPMNQFSGNNLEVLNDQDLEMAEVVTKLWVSFASDRVPNVADIRQNYPAWRPITGTSMSYYELSGNRTEMGTDFRKGEALFWLRSVPLLQSAQDEIDNLTFIPYQILFWVLLALSVLFLIVVVVLSCVLYRKRRTGKATL